MLTIIPFSLVRCWYPSQLRMPVPFDVATWAQISVRHPASQTAAAGRIRVVRAWWVQRPERPNSSSPNPPDHKKTQTSTRPKLSTCFLALRREERLRSRPSFPSDQGLSGGTPGEQECDFGQWVAGSNPTPRLACLVAGLTGNTSL